MAGEGKLTVGSEDYPFTSDSVLYLPAGQPHAIKFIAPEKGEKAEKPEKAVAVQFLASAHATGATSSPAPAAPTKPAAKTSSKQTGAVR